MTPVMTDQSKKADSFFHHLGGDFLPRGGGNDLFASIDKPNKWAFLAEYLKPSPQNQIITEVVKKRN